MPKYFKTTCALLGVTVAIYITCFAVIFSLENGILGDILLGLLLQAGSELSQTISGWRLP